MIQPIQPLPPSKPYSKPFKQRVGDIANTALNVFAVGFGVPFAVLMASCLESPIKGRRWIA